MNLFPVIQSRRLGKRPLKVIWQGTPIVLFRDETAAVRAFHDTCPHLDTSLSEGWVKDGRLVCPWHQWEFAKDGRCHHPISMSEYQCQRFEVHEHKDWIWMGAEHPQYMSQHLSLSKQLLLVNHDFKAWAYEGLVPQSDSHLSLHISDLRCDIHMYINRGITASHYRMGIWYPREWSANLSCPKIAEIMDSILSHLNP